MKASVCQMTYINMEIQASIKSLQENQEDDQKGFGIANFLNEGEKTEDVFSIIEKV